MTDELPRLAEGIVAVCFAFTEHFLNLNECGLSAPGGKDLKSIVCGLLGPHPTLAVLPLRAQGDCARPRLLAEPQALHDSLPHLPHCDRGGDPGHGRRIPDEELGGESDEEEEAPDYPDIVYVCNKTLEKLQVKLMAAEEVTQAMVNELVFPENIADEETMVPVDLRGAGLAQDYDDIEQMVEKLGPMIAAVVFLKAKEYFDANMDGEPEDERPKPMLAAEWKQDLTEDDDDGDEEELLGGNDEEDLALLELRRRQLLDRLRTQLVSIKDTGQRQQRLAEWRTLMLQKGDYLQAMTGMTPTEAQAMVDYMDKTYCKMAARPDG